MSEAAAAAVTSSPATSSSSSPSGGAHTNSGSSAPPATTTPGNQAQTKPAGGLNTVPASGGTPNKSLNSGAGSQSQAPTAPVDDELEELKVGGASHKVPKAFAKVVKDLERGFHTKAQQAAQMNKLIELAFTKPGDFYKLTGKSPRELPALRQYAEQVLADDLEYQAMSAEQKRIKELEAEKAVRDQAEQEKAETTKRERLTQLERQEDAKIRDGVFSAWKASGLPPDTKFAALIVQTKMQADAQGQDWTWDECAARVKEDWVSHVRSIVQATPSERLHEILGEEPLKKWRDYDVKRVTNPLASQSGSPSNRPAGSPRAASSTNKSKPMSEAQWREHMEKLKEGLSD